MLGALQTSRSESRNTDRALALVNEPQLIRSASVDIFITDEEVR